MYSSFSIENFRLFDRLKVEPLSRVNLIAGENNVGKTALLEALWLITRPSAALDAPQAIRRRGVRGGEQEELFANLFFNYDTSLAINLKAENQSGHGKARLAITSQPRTERPLVDWSNESETDFEEASTDIADFECDLVFQHTSESGHIYRTTAWIETATKSGTPQTVVRQDTSPGPTSNRPCEFESPGKMRGARSLAALFGRAQMGNYVPQIEKAVRLLEPRLQRLEVITDRRGTPEIHADIGIGRPFPISIMGEGTKRLLALVLSFMRAKDGLLLVDEIENGLHYSKLKAIWERVHWLSREFNVQVFATTHSYECIRAAGEAFKSNGNDGEFAYIRLQRNHRTQAIECVPYDDPEAFDYAMEYGREVR